MTHPTPLLERADELARLAAVLTGADGGSGGVAVVEGPAGIGKTRLMAAAAHEGTGFVLQARAGEIEGSFAFGVVRQLFEPLIARAAPADRARYLDGAAGLAAPLFDPTQIAQAGGEAIYPLLHGLFWLTANLAEDAPVVLLVDDAQWSDEPSLLFLEFLARRIAELPVAVIVATRPVSEAAPRSLHALLGDPASTVVRPNGLGAEAATILLEQRVEGTPEPAFVAACLEVTGGNPFLLGELARLMADERLAPVASSIERLTALGPRAIADSVLLRVARLPAGARPLVRAVAVLGDEVDPADAAQLAGLDHAAVGPLVPALRDAGVLADGRALTFAHPVLRTAVYESLPVAEREAAHEAAARLLLGRGAPDEHVAAQLLRRPGPLGPWAVAPLRGAATQALVVGDVGGALRHLRRTLEEDLDAATRTAVTAALGHAGMLAMEPTAPDTLAAVIAESSDPQAIAEAATDLGIMLLFSGRIEAFVEALGGAEQATADAPEVSARLAAGMLGAAQISFTAAQQLADRVAALRDPGGPATTGLERAALVTLAFDALNAPRPITDAQDLLRRAIVPFPETGPPDLLTSPMMASGPLIMAELYDETVQLATGNIEWARGVGATFPVAAALSVRSWAGVRRGDLLGAETDARESLDLIEAMGFQSFHRAMAHATLLDCARETGASLAPFDEVLDAEPPSADLGPNGVFLLARARALAARGEVERAVEAILDPGMAVYGESPPSYLAWRSTAAELLDQLGRHAEAVELVQEEVRRAEILAAPAALGIALRAQALLAPAADRVAGLEAAVAVLAGSAARLEHARALVDLGAAIRRAGDRAAGRERLREGHEIAVRCGATALADRAREELAASGMRLAAAGRSGAGSLTPSERRVAAMAAEGLRNRDIAQRLFVTEKTVETHLSRAYDKLGIRSRRALAEALAG
ncbi:MAG: AAA family ATPase [Patulibacter sp.]|nr:AAA family ATPase [Patulibacter sp.]